MLGLWGVGERPLGDLPTAPAPPVVVITAKIGALGAFAIGQQSSQSGSLSYSLIADAGAFAVIGIAALFKTSMVANVGAYAVTGNAASLGSVLAAGSGSYIVTGNAADLAATSTWNERPEQTENWSQASDQDDIWTEKSEESEGWTPQAPLFN